MNEGMKERIMKEAIQLRHQLHREPELSLQEYKTKDRLIKFLEAHTKLEIHPFEQWFYAVYRAAPRADGKTVRRLAFRADLDALPLSENLDIPYASETEGVSHKCGHDGHAAALAALARLIYEEGAPHDIYFIFQAAEEIGAGAALALEALRGEKLDAVYSWHNMSALPEGEVCLIAGPAQCASHGQKLFYKGTKAHASEPEKGRNPIYALGEFIHLLPELCRPELFSDLCFTVPVYAKAGAEAFGITAEEAVLYLTNRAARDEDLSALRESLEKKWAGLADKNGLACRFEYTDVFPATINDPGETAKVEEACRRLNMPFRERFEPYAVSEDFGHFLKEIPGCIFYIGNGEQYPAIHTDAYDFNDRLLEPAVRLLFALARQP